MSDSGSASTLAAEIRTGAPVPSRFWWLTRLGLGVVGLLAGVLAIHFLLDHRSRQIWDTYIAERRAAGEPILAEDFTSPAVPDEQNAAEILNAVGPSIRLLVDSGEFPIHFFEADLSAVRSFQVVAHGKLAAASDLLCELESLHDLDVADWKVRLKSPLINTMMPMLSHLRATARLCAFAAVVEHDRCNDGQALEHLSLGLHVAALTRRGQFFLIGDLTAAACESLTLEGIATIQPNLLIDEIGNGGACARRRVRELIAILLDESEVRLQFRNSLRFERSTLLDTFVCIADGTLPTAGWWRPLPPPVEPLLPAWRASMIGAGRRLDRLGDALAAPSFPEARARMPILPDDAQGGPAQLADALRALLEGDLSSAVRIHYHMLAMRRMAATALAMRLFELDCGGPPESLEELVPDYLPAVPLDPMDGDGRPIGYVRTEHLPRLYSVGSDGIDEEGRIDWTYGYPESPRQEEILLFLTDRPRPLRNDLYSTLLKLYETPAAPANGLAQADEAQPATDQSPRGQRE